MATNTSVTNRLRSALDLLAINSEDLGTLVLRRVGAVHRAQQAQIFASQGAVGGRGPWKPLAPRYAAWKARVKPGAKILVFSGDMKERFVNLGRPEHVETFVPTGPGAGYYLLGARSDRAAAHLYGRALPVRDPITKSPAQVAELRQTIADWYRNERLPQVLRHIKNPGGA